MYSSRVQAQKQRNPCLSDLHEFLQQPGPARDLSRIVCLEYSEHYTSPAVREISVGDLHGELKSSISSQKSSRPICKGRIFMVEDASKYTIEEFGMFFNIDPWFFASYIHQAWRKTSTQSPTNCSLPSRDKKQNFLSLQYHRTVTFQQKDTKMRSLTRNCNQQRKAVILPTMGEERIGLMQHCCSVLLVDNPEKCWTGIVLVDAPISNNYTASKRHGPLPPNLNSTPFLGGCEDFSSSLAIDLEKVNPAAVSDRGMLEELVHHWTKEAPPMFDASNPTLRALSYYPLKIVAAEWVNYIAVMGMSIREYELSAALSGDLVTELDKLNSNLRILQGWRRRILATQAKLRRTIRFVEYHVDHKLPNEDWDVLVDDFEFIRTEVAEHGERLEAMVPLVTSVAALIEGRRGLTEAANVTRLTVLAVVFLPLSYIASIFSMSDDFRPGGSLFWVYFVAAVPSAVVVGLFARPPVKTTKRVLNKFGIKMAKSI